MVDEKRSQETVVVRQKPCCVERARLKPEREKGGLGARRESKVKRCAVAKLCHASPNKWSNIDQRDEGRPPRRHSRDPNGIPSRSLAVARRGIGISKRSGV